jgi:uncharacterized protein YaiL (DUF2058 family)
VQNLRDKLLKAGLVTAEQAEKAAEAPARPPVAKRGQRPDGAGGAEGRTVAAGAGPWITARLKPLGAVPKLPPLAGSKASQRLEAKRQLERDRQLRDRVTSAQIAVEPGERAFYFVTRKNRLRRLELSVEQAEALEHGRLAVVERPDPAQIEHALVPAALASELLADFPKAVRFLNAPGASVGFLSDEEVRNRAAAEAAETPEERAAADAPESAEERAEAEAADEETDAAEEPAGAQAPEEQASGGAAGAGLGTDG